MSEKQNPMRYASVTLLLATLLVLSTTHWCNLAVLRPILRRFHA